MKTASALFDTFKDANAAIKDLTGSGFTQDTISLLSSNHDKAYNTHFDDEGRYVGHAHLGTGEGAAAGAGIGAALGGLGGVLMGLGLLVIPGVGPALAAGALASGLLGAGIGGAAGGVTGALVNTGVSAEDALHYQEGVRRGGHLVVVSTKDDAYSTAQAILQRHNPVSVRERAEAWRKEGYHDPTLAPLERSAHSLDDR